VTTTPTTIQTYVLRFATSLIPTSTEYLTVYKPMIDEIEQKSGGRIKFTVYPGGSLVPKSQQYDSIMAGIVDVGITYFSDVATRFPLYETLTFPVAYEVTNAGEGLVQTLNNRILSTSPNDTRVFCLFQQQPSLYFSKTNKNTG
jgi:TRAP-type C4-dicarboxylate transport system substrate-binding protein